MTLLGIDIGTTHCKAGLFSLDGAPLRIATRPTVTRNAPDGRAFFDPEELWATATEAIREALVGASDPVAAVGIASMAESGLLLDRRGGRPRSAMLPWFDTAAQPQAEALLRRRDAQAIYTTTGLRVTYKCGLAKLLWLRESDPAITDGAIWLSAADYIAFRLTGAFGTDYSLAGRTCAFDIERKRWDAAWLDTWGLDADVFPPASPAGTPIGQTTSALADLGLTPGIPVAVSGHDHVCAALAAGAIQAGQVFDSMGTAEALIGAFPARPLAGADFQTGLAAGCHALAGVHYWMGGLSTSGGAVAWLRALLGAEPLSHADLLALVESAGPDPTGLLFFPYLLGSGSPHSDPLASGAFVGLRASHTRAHLAKAGLEGLAYEVELIRRAGEALSGQPIDSVTVAGGGSRNPALLQIKADVSGCRIEVFPESEATLLGAALAAGIGCGLYPDAPAALAAIAGAPRQVVQPDPERHAAYRALYENGFLRLQAPLHEFARSHPAGSHRN